MESAYEDKGTIYFFYESTLYIHNVMIILPKEHICEKGKQVNFLACFNGVCIWESR